MLHTDRSSRSSSFSNNLYRCRLFSFKIMNRSSESSALFSCCRFSRMIRKNLCDNETKCDKNSISHSIFSQRHQLLIANRGEQKFKCLIESCKKVVNVTWLNDPSESRFNCSHMELIVPFSSYQQLRFFALLAGLLGVVSLISDVMTLLEIPLLSMTSPPRHACYQVDLIRVFSLDYEWPWFVS